MAHDIDRSIFFDDDYNIRILDVEKFNSSKSLQENCSVFVQNIEKLQDVVNKFVTAIDGQVGKVEAEKLRAVGLRNQVATLNEERRRKQKEQENLLAAKQQELERLVLEEKSLAKVRQEQELLIAKLTDSSTGASFS